MRVKYQKKSVKKIERRRQDEKRLTFLFVTIVSIFAFILLYYLPKAAPSREILLHEGKGLLSKTRLQFVTSGFKEIGMDTAPDGQISITFEIPENRDALWAFSVVESRLKANQLTIRKTIFMADRRGFNFYVNYFAQPVGVMTFLREEKPLIQPLPSVTVPEKPQLVVIIDDFGYSDNEVIHGFLELPARLTLSIIPGHTFSKWVAEIAQRKRKEVIIHMPMEPENGNYSRGEDNFMLKTTLTPDEVESRLNLAYDELPTAAGLNNHMGSLFTADSAMMQIVVKSLRKKGLYFIDSMTSPKSVGYEIAQKNGLPSAMRTVFLDNKRDKNEIQRQFDKAIEIARRSGKAVVIGHVYPETLSALKALIGGDLLLDVEIVFASEIVS